MLVEANILAKLQGFPFRNPPLISLVRRPSALCPVSQFSFDVDAKKHSDKNAIDGCQHLNSFQNHPTFPPAYLLAFANTLFEL